MRQSNKENKFHLPFLEKGKKVNFENAVLTVRHAPREDKSLSIPHNTHYMGL